MAETTLDLYRSVRKEQFPQGVIVDDHAVEGVLYPSFEDSTYVDGGGKTRPRRADVYPYVHSGEAVIDPGGGASLFDRSKVFGTKFWWYFTIPKGTVIPDSLRVVFTGRNNTYNADHYQIEAAVQRLPVQAYKQALDNLARNAVVKLLENR